MLAVLKQFRVVIGSMKEHYRDLERATGVSGAQLWALCAVAASPGMKVGDLALELAIHQSTASNLLDRLAELGHIERRREGADQRVVTIHLSKSGHAAVKRAPQPAIGILQNALLSLSTPQLMALQGNLHELILAIGVKRNSGAATPLSMVLRDGDRKGAARR